MNDILELDKDLLKTNISVDVLEKMLDDYKNNKLSNEEFMKYLKNPQLYEDFSVPESEIDEMFEDFNFEEIADVFQMCGYEYLEDDQRYSFIPNAEYLEKNARKYIKEVIFKFREYIKNQYNKQEAPDPDYKYEISVGRFKYSCTYDWDSYKGEETKMQDDFYKHKGVQICTKIEFIPMESEMYSSIYVK